MTKKGKKIRIFALALTLCIAFAFACACNEETNDTQPTVTLTDFNDETDFVTYGSQYILKDYAVGNDGQAYACDTIVQDSKGNAVSIAFGKFTVLDYDGYVVEYTVELGDNTYTRTVRISVTAAAPMLTVQSQMTAFIDERVAIPTCSVLDYIDGEIETYQTEIYKRTDGDDEKQTYDAETRTFIPATAGEYYVLYTATNSKQVSATAQTQIEVEDPADYLPYVVEMTEENKNSVYYEGVASRTRFVKANTDELKSIEGDYRGNAVRFNAQYGYDGQFRVKNIYSQAALEKMKQTYSYVSLWTAYNIVQDAKEPNTTGELYFLDNNTSTQTQYLTYWTKANRLGTYYAVGNNVWSKWTIAIDDYISLVAENDYKYFVLFCLANRHDIIDEINSGIYIGDITFEETLNVPNPMTCNGMTCNAYTYNGNATNYTTYYTADNLAQAGFTGDYTGNAVAYKVLGGHSGQYRVNNTLTVLDLETKKNDGYNAVSLWIAFDMQKTDAASTTYCINFLTGHNSFFSKAGVSGTKTSEALGDKLWTKVSISIDDYAALIAENANYVVLFHCGDRQSILADGARIYVGDIVFDKV